MSDKLTGETTIIKRRRVDVNLWPMPVLGISPTGIFGPIACTEPTYATGTLTSDGTVPTENDTFTVDGRVYRWRDTLAQAYDVKIGATAAISLDNAKLAVNSSGTSGTHYYAGTEAHPTVEATTNTDTTQLLVARHPGALGNTITLEESGSHTSVSGALFTGGADAKLGVDGSFTVDSEFPAAAALADNTATPTTTSVGAFNMVYDGATWDFLRGTAADGALVNLGTNNDVSIITGQAGVAGGSGGVSGATLRTTQAGLDYETVAAGQTEQVLGATGATGDYLSHVILQPAAVGAGTTTILDNATVIYTYTAGTLADLRPIVIPLNLISVSGAWKITTGANMAAIGVGDFT